MIKKITEKNIKQALDLAGRVFAEFVAVDYSEQGRSTFENYLTTKYDEVASDMKAGYKKMWGYYSGGRIIGIIASRNDTHISLLFVDKQYHCKGIARALFSHYLKETGKDCDISKITVNSSPYAVKAYERLGFTQTAEQQEKDGIIYIPMAYEHSPLRHIDKIHTTPMGEQRIRRNLDLKTGDIAAWCREAVKNADIIIGQGKNWYAYYGGAAITVNAGSFTVITAHKIKGKIRAMTPSDYPVLKEFLYQSIFVPEGAAPPSREITSEPEIYIYIKDFGQSAGDIGVVAEQNGQIVGAAWTRIMPSGEAAAGVTPELAVSVFPEFRGCGIGTRMLTKLLWLLKENGYTQTSLHVQKDNPAVRLYGRLGYRIAGARIDHAGNEDYIMIKEL